MAGSALQRIIQTDFGVGMQPDAARHLIDPSGVYDIQDGLLDDDGSVYRRGGSSYHSGANFGSALRWVWDGYLDAGHRTVFANPADFGVLGADDSTVTNIGGAGLLAPVSAAMVEGLLFIPKDTTTTHIYAGSRKSANYSTGTVSVTNGSRTVTGSGTTWNTLVDEGMLFQRGNERVYVVDTVNSTTSITLRDAYEGVTGSGISYTLYPIYSVTASDPYEASANFAVSGSKLIRADGDTVYVSTLNLTTGVSEPHVWDPNDYHRIPEGVAIFGLGSIGDSLLVFTSEGVWAISGMAYNIVDDLGNPQRRQDNISRNIVLWGEAGIAAYKTGLVVPALDSIYLMDASSTPTQVAHPIENLYRRYVNAGYKPGKGAVFNEHYFLPILDAGNETVDLLVSRLDRPVRFRNTTSFPWARQSGQSGKVSAVAARNVDGEIPRLLGAANRTTSRLLRLDDLFVPAASRKNDPDGSTFDLIIITRDYMTGDLTRNRIRRFRLSYVLEDAASDDPKIALDYSEGLIKPGGTYWGQFDYGEANWFDSSEGEFTTLDGEAPESDGIHPYTWHFAKWTRRARFRVRSSGPAAKLTVRHIELFIAPAQNVRH